MSEIKRYRKKPVVIEAVQWDGTGPGAIPILDWLSREGCRNARWCAEETHVPGPGRGITTITDRIEIPTLEGVMIASPGDWIIRVVQGEFYPCRNDIFQKTYEAVKTP